jgi:hypothetical protein
MTTVVDVIPYLNTAGLGIICWVMVQASNKSSEKIVTHLIERDGFFVKNMGTITRNIEVIASNIGRTFLKPSQALSVFKAILHEHIDKKVDFCRGILEKNNIKKRRKNIELNIRSRFEEITREEGEKLSDFTTPAGDLGLFLCKSIDWDEYLKNIYAIFFSESTVDLKCKDMKHLMKGMVTTMMTEIEEKMRTNSL